MFSISILKNVYLFFVLDFIYVSKFEVVINIKKFQKYTKHKLSGKIGQVTYC